MDTNPQDQNPEQKSEPKADSLPAMAQTSMPLALPAPDGKQEAVTSNVPAENPPTIVAANNPQLPAAAPMQTAPAQGANVDGGNAAPSTAVATDDSKTLQANDANETSKNTEENGAIETADTWLEIVEADITEEDILAHVNRLRGTAIRPVDGTHFWKATVNMDGNSFDISIDLDNVAWRSGTANEIMRRLLDRKPDAVGVTVTPSASAPALLTEPWIKLLLDSESHVIDPNPMLPQLSLAENLPAGAKYAIVDLPGLIATRVDVSQMNAAEMEEFFSSHLLEYEQHIECYNDVNQFLRRTDATSIHEMVAAIFTELGRAPNEPLSSVYMTLTSALAARVTVDILYESVAGMRELMLALRMVERDPTAAVPQSEKIQEILRHNVELQNERDLRLALDALLAIEMPEGGTSIEGEKQSGPLTLDSVGKHLASEEANINQGAVNLQILEFIGDIAAYLDTNEELKNRVSEKYGSIQSGFDHKKFALAVEQAFNDVQNEDKSPVLSSASAYEQSIQENFDQLRQAQEERREAGPSVCWTIAKRALQHQGIDGEELEDALEYLQEKIRSMRPLARTGGDLSIGAFPYEGDDNKTAVDEWNKGKTFLRIRDRLSIPGMTFAAGVAFSGPFFYADAMLHAGIAVVVGSLIGGIVTAMLKPHGPFKGFNALAEYERILYRFENIGLTLDEAGQPERSDIRFIRLVDAYFHLKYLYTLPTDDPKRLPKSQALTRTLRRMHAAIINRAQESFLSSENPVSQGEIKQMHDVGMRVDESSVKSLSAIDRVQIVHDFLIGNVYYTAQRKQEMQEMVERCYAPIQKVLDRHERVASLLRHLAFMPVHLPRRAKSEKQTAVIDQKTAEKPAVAAVPRAAIPPPLNPSPCM